jgi:two-component system, chemotaxis family, sensor kinase CheA
VSHDPHQDDDIVAELLPAFIQEANEQIAELEHLLLQLEDQPDDLELLNALFRCAHTIKGSAGVFGLNRIVSFTHHVETLLDKLREGLMHLTPALSNLLLQSNDAISVLVKTAHESGESEPEVVLARQALVEQLQAATSAVSAPVAAVSQSMASVPAVAADGVPAGGGRWHLSVQFGSDTFRHGMDPLTLLNYVGKLGDIHQVACDVDAIPALDAFDPESCHLAFELSLDTEADREKIEGAFSFVREDCELRLIEPGATAADFVALIAEMPNHPRLGDILISVGAVSRAQLDEALALQSQAKAGAGLAPPIGEVLQSSAGVSPQVVDAALNKQQRQREALGAASAPDDKGFIRVHANRLDEVINLLGELVIAGAGASLQARQTRQRGLIEANQRITRLIEGIRNSTLKLRMVHMGDTFARFRRVVRDTAAELGKDVELELLGGETELDKAMVERITDPLMHLVRNALDHGLETPSDRLAAGKAAQGRLTLSACHESGSVLIKITDNGRGIQRQKVLQRAWDRGLVEAGHVPHEEDIFKLIFEPGFSTAEAITNLSGRGVGMDVVRRNIEAMRGSVALSSQEGQGSTIEIRLPLTLAIIDGFLIGVGSSKFIFPLESVVEVIEGKASAATLDDQGRCWVELRGQVLPVVNLRTLYSLDSMEPERCSIVVVRAGNRRFGVMVDSLLGQHQTVIKPLGLMLRSLRGVSGSSILGTGEVALIFDVVSLGQLASSPGRGRAPTSKASVSFAPSVDTPVL